MRNRGSDPTLTSDTFLATRSDHALGEVFTGDIDRQCRVLVHIGQIDQTKFRLGSQQAVELRDFLSRSRTIAPAGQQLGMFAGQVHARLSIPMLPLTQLKSARRIRSSVL